MAESKRDAGYASRLLVAAGVLIGTGVAVLVVWLAGWGMVERAAGPITAWVFASLVVLAGALWGIRAGVRVARFFAPTEARAGTRGTDTD